MRKIVTAIMGTISGLVLLFSYHTSTNSQAAATTTGGTDTDTGSTSTSGTYTGDAVETQWGTVQVQITVENGQITSADAIQYPNGNRHDQQINAYAIPQLNAAVVEAQSASIDTISGATVTSDGYLQSLQSAIDAAHL
ncbi:MAG: FMN-binding protein [Propionibacteriaceae bacterium]|nr:FMN-binding protein [Propionibacteriaceae bacterium]